MHNHVNVAIFKLVSVNSNFCPLLVKQVFSLPHYAKGLRYVI